MEEEEEMEVGDRSERRYEEAVQYLLTNTGCKVLRCWCCGKSHTHKTAGPYTRVTTGSLTNVTKRHYHTPVCVHTRHSGGTNLSANTASIALDTLLYINNLLSTWYKLLK